MAIKNSETINIDLSSKIDLNKNNTNIMPFEGFAQNNGIIYDGSLHNISYKVNNNQIVLNDEDKRFSIEGNILYDDKRNKVATFNYEHFEINDIDEIKTLNVIDYYEDSENKILLSDDILYINGKAFQLSGEIKNVISSKLLKDKTFITYKNVNDSTYFYIIDYTDAEDIKEKAYLIDGYNTYQNKIIYDEKYELFSLIESSYDSMITFKIIDDALVKYTFQKFNSSDIFMYAADFILGNGKCASLKSYVNVPASVMKGNTIFRIEEVDDDSHIIKYVEDIDISAKSVSGFYGNMDRNNVYYNNGFFNHSATLNKVETEIQGSSNRERIQVSLSNVNNVDMKDVIAYGKMDNSGVIKYDTGNYLTQYLKQKPMLFFKGLLISVRLMWAYKETESNGIYWPATNVYSGWSGGPQSSGGVCDVGFQASEIRDVDLKVKAPDGPARKDHDVFINNKKIGTLKEGESEFSFRIKYKSYAPSIIEKRPFVLKDAPNSYVNSWNTSSDLAQRLASDVWENGAAIAPNSRPKLPWDCYLVNGKYIDLNFNENDKFITNETITLIFDDGTEIALSNDLKLEVGDNVWGLVDLFQSLSYTRNLYIRGQTYDGWSIYVEKSFDNIEDWWFEFIAAQNNGLTFPTFHYGGLKRIVTDEYGVKRYFDYNAYITVKPASAVLNTYQSLIKGRRFATTGQINNFLGYSINSSLSGNHIKSVSSTLIDKKITLTGDFLINLNSFTLSDNVSATQVGDGNDTNGLSVYGNIFRKGNYNLLYNNNTLTGISYSENDNIGTLLTPWFSVDEDFEIKTYDNVLIYRDKNKIIKRIEIKTDESLRYDYVLDKYLIFNTTSYINCIDLSTLTKHHYASDYNNRVRYAGLLTIDDLFEEKKNVLLSTGINANYELTNGLTSMIVNPNMIQNVYGNRNLFYYKNCNMINDLIDVYQSIDGELVPKYTNSLKIISDLSYSTIKRNELMNVYWPIDTEGNILLNPSLTAKFSKNYFKNYVMLLEGSSYIGLTQNIKNYLLYYITSEFEGLQNVFNIQGIVYGVTKDKIYRLNITNGILSDYDVVAKISGLKYLGAVINEALFFSPVNNNIYTFTGDNNLQVKISGTQIKDVYNSFYNTSTQDLYVSTDIGLIVFSMINNYVLTKIGNIDLKRNCVKDIYFPNDNKYIMTFIDIADGSCDISFTDENEEFVKEKLILSTLFYGELNNRKNKCSCWNITLKTNDINKEGELTLKSETLTDTGTQSNETKIKIRKKDWDKLTKTFFVRYQPKYQNGVGNKLNITSDFPISALSVDITRDSKQIAKNNF